MAQDSGNVKYGKHTEQPLPLPIQQKNCSINTDGDIKTNKCTFFLLNTLYTNRSEEDGLVLSGDKDGLAGMQRLRQR